MTDSINNIVPGTPVTDEQKKKLAKDNTDATTDAHRLAAEHRQRDIDAGRGEPAVNAVAGLIQKKLENDEFEQPPQPPTKDA